MAYDGELVKMANVAGPRFQRCVCRDSDSTRADASILVAVELDEHYQELLNAAEDSLESYRRRGIPVHVSIDPEGKGKVSLTFEGHGAEAH